MNNKINALIQEFSNSPETVFVKTSAISDNVEQDIVKYTLLEEKIKKTLGNIK